MMSVDPRWFSKMTRPTNNNDDNNNEAHSPSLLSSHLLLTLPHLSTHHLRPSRRLSERDVNPCFGAKTYFVDVLFSIRRPKFTRHSSPIWGPNHRSTYICRSSSTLLPCFKGGVPLSVFDYGQKFLSPYIFLFDKSSSLN